VCPVVRKTDAIGDDAAGHQTQRAVLEEHKEQEEHVGHPAQDREDMKVKLVELQELVI
jgi:hypothetical protein